MSAMPNSTVPIHPSIVMALCAGISLGTLAMTGPARADSDYTKGVGMMKMCKPFADDPRDALPCILYIVGAYEALTLWNPFWTRVCVPSISTVLLVSTVLDYARRHPEELDKNAITLIMSALGEDDPCRPGEHRPHTQ
jgi:hypothetical protein